MGQTALQEDYVGSEEEVTVVCDAPEALPCSNVGLFNISTLSLSTCYYDLLRLHNFRSLPFFCSYPCNVRDRSCWGLLSCRWVPSSDSM